MMNIAAEIAGLFAGALLSLFAVRTIRVSLSIGSSSGLLELPNLVQIRRVKKPSVQ